MLSACQTVGSKQAVLEQGGASVGPAPQLAVYRLRCPDAGTVLKTSNGKVIEFNKKDGAICDANSNGRKISTIYNYVSASHRSAPEAKEALSNLHLKTGNKTSYESPGTTECPGCTWHNEFVVERTETINTAAGVFDTFVIRWNQIGRGYEHEIWDWYSPDLGLPVKRKAEFLRGSSSGWNSFEATEIIRPKS